MRLLDELSRDFDVRAWLSEKPHKEHGDNWSIDCPECGKDDRLWVLVKDKPGKRAGAWICYHCKEAGMNALGLVSMVEDCDVVGAASVLRQFSRREPERAADVRGAVEKALSACAAAEEDEEEPEGGDEATPLPAEFVPLATARRWPAYVTDRGLDRRDCASYDLGFCETGYYRNRLVVPVKRKGEVRWFLGRWMRKVPPRGVKKVVNSPGARSSNYLFNWDTARRGRSVVLVEDVFSAIRVGASGAATFGTQFSRAQLGLLATSDVSEVVVMWDRDALPEAYDLAKRIAGLWDVRVVELPDERDPDEHSRASIEGMLAEARRLDERSAFCRSISLRLSGGKQAAPPRR